MKTQENFRKNYTLIALVMIVFFVISFITNILNSIIADVKQSFQLSHAATGLLPFSFFIAYGIMSVPAGFLAEKYRERTILSWSFVCIIIASLGFALLPKYPVFMITLFCLGCSMAVLQVIINPMLRVAGGEEHFAFNSVLAQLLFGLASFVSPLLYSKIALAGKGESADSFFHFFLSLVPAELPWSALYLFFAMIGFLLLLIVLGVRYPKVTLKEDEKAGSKTSYLALLKLKTTWLFFFGIFAYVGVEQGIGNWITSFLQEYHGIDPQTEGAQTVSNFWGMLTAGCLLGLLLLKIMDSRKVLIIFTTLSMVCLGMALTMGPFIATLAFPAIGFFISVMWSIIFSLALNSVREHHGSFSGILCSGIAGGAIMPLIVGGISEWAGLKFGMFFIFLPLIYIFSIGFWAKPVVTNKTIRLTNNK